MPKFKEYIKKLEAENAKLVEENKVLAHDRYMAERHYDAERIENDFLKREIAEWKNTAAHLMEQLMKSKAALAIEEEKNDKLKGKDGIPMPF